MTRTRRQKMKVGHVRRVRTTQCNGFEVKLENGVYSLFSKHRYGSVRAAKREAELLSRSILEKQHATRLKLEQMKREAGA